MLAAGLRTVRLGQSPPGIHVDAAANAWNARCLLETGRDWRGATLPVFYGKGFGENQTTLYYYALLPFQAVGGMSAITTCLPSVVGGVVSVLLIFLLGTRLFGRGVGLIAAALLAVMPWHLLLSRWGHESGLVPLLTLAPIVALAAAGLPFGEAEKERPRPVICFLAGALLGVCCYGYYAMRIFLPAFLLALVLVNGRAWLALAKERRGRLAIGALALGLAVTLGPLAHRHLTDPEISKRGRQLLLWDASDSLVVKTAKVATRYFEHFGPDFLFGRGDVWPLHSLPGSGPFPWYMLPLLVAGAVVVFRELRSSVPARVLCAWVLLYPIGDLFTRHFSLHLLRSAPGLCGLVLLGALGASRSLRWLDRRSRHAAIAVGSLVALGLLVMSARFCIVFFGEYNRNPEVYHVFNTDLLEASRWIRPKLDGADAVFFSCADSAALSQPFVITLVGFDYDPDRWFRETADIEHRPDTDVYRRYGKVHFLFDDSDLAAIRALEANGRNDRVIFVLRPGEWKDRSPVHEIRGPDGRAAFLIYEEVI